MFDADQKPKAAAEKYRPPKYRAPALEKGLDIIELLAGCGDGLSQGDIVRALDRSQGEIYRMLTTLVRRGYVVRSSEDDRYALSLKMFALSQRHPPIERLLEIAIPRMRTLARRTWQSCHIGMESNGDIVVVASAESPGSWGLALRTGTVVGLSNTGSGRVLAAFRDEASLMELMKRHRLAAGEPPLDRGAFLADLIRIRAQGYEKMPSATVVGVTNLAYPILDQDGAAVAALSCPYLERIDGLAVPDLEEVHALYRRVAGELGDYYCGIGSLSEETDV